MNQQKQVGARALRAPATLLLPHRTVKQNPEIPLPTIVAAASRDGGGSEYEGDAAIYTVSSVSPFSRSLMSPKPRIM